MAIKLSDEKSETAQLCPEFYLVVWNAFGDYRRGDVITNAEKMKEILSSSHVDHVHKISAQGV